MGIRRKGTRFHRVLQVRNSDVEFLSFDAAGVNFTLTWVQPPPSIMYSSESYLVTYRLVGDGTTFESDFARDRLNTTQRYRFYKKYQLEILVSSASNRDNVRRPQRPPLLAVS